jgi:hypothetical protein
LLFRVAFDVLGRKFPPSGLASPLNSSMLMLLALVRVPFYFEGAVYWAKGWEFLLFEKSLISVGFRSEVVLTELRGNF